MIYVTSIVLKSWFQKGAVPIASKDDSHTLGGEVLGRNLRRHLKQRSGSASAVMKSTYRGFLRVLQHPFPKESTGEAVNEQREGRFNEREIGDRYLGVHREISAGPRS